MSGRRKGKEADQTAQRQPSSTAAQTTPASSGRYTAVEINPQFVVVRNFKELDATVRAARAQKLPPRSTVYDGAVRKPPPRRALLPVTEPPEGLGKPPLPTAAVDAASCADANASINPDVTSPLSATSTTHSPVNGALQVGCGHAEPGTSPLVGPHWSPPTATLQPTHSSGQSSPRKSHGSTAHDHGSSKTGQSARRLLCVWDVDDTLVVSGATGVRQTPVFASEEMHALFRALPGTRHLMLSQGSVDDVFFPGNGRLRYLEKFFAYNGTSEKGKGPQAAGDGTSGSGKSGKMKGAFSCGGTKEREAPQDNLGVFERGTALIRLTSVGTVPEGPEDTQFMYDAEKVPKTHGSTTKDLIRWLVLRPSTWGITLASLASLIVPSRNTAFVDGKIFHKMDVVWSLARSGLWDTVFFVDNNLSEVGIAKYGMKLSNVFELQSTHQMHHFFHAEFMLLAASAKLLELQKQYGRDVTRPPPSSTRCDTPVRGMKRSGSVASNSAAAELAARAASSSVFGGTEREENQPTKESLDSSSVSTKGSKSPTRASSKPPRSRRGSIGSRNASTAGGSSTFLPGDSKVSQKSGQLSEGRKSTAGSVPTTPASPVHPERCRNVDLVIAHFHMDAEKYRKLVIGRRAQKVDAATLRSERLRITGQPTFIGDTSLTDEQYDAILYLFRQEESCIYAFMDEDMRTNGYIDTGRRERWTPATRYVRGPLYRRPLTIPHIRQYYQKVCLDIERRIAVPLLEGAGRVASSSVIRSDAHILLTQLLRHGPFIDAEAVGPLGSELFLVMAAEGDISKSNGDYVFTESRSLAYGPNARNMGKYKDKKKDKKKKK